ncbi:unnamed protein product [Rotaria sordida]|uniref:PLAT domain-containing protein n=1 Tax=Rotaria sordida TaxID=392033 RepID=A0A818T267_9BILA|nr:unnamed protein product [Rotaria sordida]
MLRVRDVILLLFIITDDQNWVSANVDDLLLFNDKNYINDLKINKYCRTNQSSGISNSNKEKFLSNSFLNIFISNKDFINVQNNDTNQNIYCRQQTINSLDLQFKKSISNLNENLNISEKFELNTQLISITLEKLSSNNITDKQLFQLNGANVRFPQLNINKSIIIKLITLPFSSIVSLTLHDQYGQIINIKNTTNPFEIFIPRKTNILMPSMIRENVTLLSNNLKFKFYYINLTHNLNLSISLHIEIEPENQNLSYLFIIRFSNVPNLKKNLIDEWKLMCPKDRKPHTSKYIYFIDNTRISHHQWAIIGIREMKECNRNNLDDNIQFSSDYSIRMYTSGCYYLDDNNNWQSDGLIVGSKTNESFTQCYSTHLTTFAASLVFPTPVPWHSLDFDFKRNITIYITLIIIGLVYFLTTGFSYYKDGIDAKMLMVIPLSDNNRHDKYLYQLVVFTGMRANAGTKSKVHFLLSGNQDETDIRKLTANRRIFARGNVDSFIMAVPRSLGQLNYLRIWHDNSGSDSDASWFLKYVLVRDLQTMETSYFICEKWLAVEKDSGDIDVTINAASELETMELKHVLSKNAYRSMADNHLWFSIFAYHLPSAKRFTRVQRCTCCFVVFFMSLLMSILYYDTKQEINANENDQYGLTIGPFHLSKEEIIVGIIVEFITFCPSLILVALFRRSKPRHPRTISPVGEAIQNIRANKLETKTQSHSIESRDKKLFFPWWCLILAYILSLLMVITSVFFIIVRSVEYGDSKTRRWLGSILASFCASVFLTQPLKVLALALMFMCLCRKKSQVEAFIEKEDPVEEFTISTEDAHRKFPSKSLLAKTHLDAYRIKREKQSLKKLREIRLKEVKSWFILRELFFLLLFLGILYAISFANRDVEHAHQMVKYLRHDFLKIDYRYSYKNKLGQKKNIYIFENINSIKDYWNWLENIFIDKYFEIQWNDCATNKTSILRNTQTNNIIGWPILRQLRVKNESCPRKALNGHIEIDNCNLPYTWYNEAKHSFGFNISKSDSQKLTQPFKYKSIQDDTLIYSTSHATYMAGGYVHEIQGITKEQILNGFQYLQNHHWIDRYTRAIFLTFSLYNPNANLFVYCSLLLEQLPATTNLIFRSSFQPFKLIQLYTGKDLIYCIIYLILIIYYTIIEIKIFLKVRKAYMKQFWSYINWAIIICSWIGVAIHILRQTEVNKMGNSLKLTKGRRPINLQFFSYLDSVLTYLLSFCCFFGTIKILRLLRFNRRLSLFHLTLKKSMKQIIGFLLMFSLVFCAFNGLFYLLFHPYLKQYSTWLYTSLTCFEMISRHMSTVSDLKNVNPLLAGLSLFLFILIAVFLLSNMFISIIVDNFNLLRRELLKHKNEIELIQFTKTKIKQWLNITTYKQEIEKKNPIIEFPNKVNKLANVIDKLYDDTKY